MSWPYAPGAPLKVAVGPCGERAELIVRRVLLHPPTRDVVLQNVETWATGLKEWPWCEQLRLRGFCSLAATAPCYQHVLVAVFQQLQAELQKYLAQFLDVGAALLLARVRLRLFAMRQALLAGKCPLRTCVPQTSNFKVTALLWRLEGQIQRVCASWPMHWGVGEVDPRLGA